MSTNYPFPDPYSGRPGPPGSGRRQGEGVLPWILVVILVAAGGFLAWWFWPRGDDGTNANAQPRAVTPRGSLAEEEKTTIKIFKEASPSVVHVTALTAQRNPFNLNVQRVPADTGTGFIWDRDGHIVTNYHVVQNAMNREGGAAKVTLADHSTWDVEWVRAYPDKDLAVLWIKAPASRLKPIMVGTSHDLQVGQDSFAIGNPFGLDHTLTKGIISALDREIQAVTGSTIRGAIQTDAAINPGNSGGPLLDSAGRLIGVNTAIISPSRASAGIGFAIPVDEVNRVIPQLIRHGKVVHPSIGVEIADDSLMNRIGLEGALILDVKAGSPAAKAELRPTRRTPTGHIQLGDIIVAVNGRRVQSKTEFYALMDQFRKGDTVTLTVLRGDEEVDVKVPLDGAT